MDPQSAAPVPTTCDSSDASRESQENRGRWIGQISFRRSFISLICLDGLCGSSFLIEERSSQQRSVGRDLKILSIARKTESEERFETYLTGLNLVWQRVAQGQDQTPDYRITHGKAACFFEVKEFNNPEVPPVGGFSPCGPIRKKIKAAAKQLKNYRDECCAVVLWNSKTIHRTSQPEIVCSAAFGERVFRDPNLKEDVGIQPPRWRFLGTASLTKIHNTRVSAIVVLSAYRLDNLWLAAWRRMDAQRRSGEVAMENQFEVLNELSPRISPRYSFEGTIRSVVTENPHARVAFPPNLLMGPFDQRWRMRNGWFTVVELGSELRRLQSSGIPFACL